MPHRRFLQAAMLLVLSLCVGACRPTPEESSTPTLTPRPTNTLEPSATPTATPTVTPSPTITSTPGPGLDELIGTPEALVRGAALEDALAAYEELADLYPDQAAPRLGQAALALRDGDFDAARDYLEQAVDAEPANLEALRQYALLLDQQEAYGDLAEVYGLMLEIAPDDADLYIARALTYARLGQGDDAVVDLQQAQTIDDTRPFTWLNVAGAASGSRHYETAIAVSSAALEGRVSESDSYQVSLLIERGLAYYSLDDVETAFVDFEKAVTLDELNVNALLWYGRAAAELRRLDEAQQALERAAELGVLSGISGVNLGYEAMADVADVLARSDPQAAFSYMATQVFEYGSLDPLLMGYARIDWRRGQPEDAVGRLGGLVADDYIPALYWRGIIYWEMGEFELAADDLARFIEIRTYGPQSEAARRILESIGD